MLVDDEDVDVVTKANDAGATPADDHDGGETMISPPAWTTESARVQSVRLRVDFIVIVILLFCDE